MTKTEHKATGKIGQMVILVLLIAVGTVVFYYPSFFNSAKTISELLHENQFLKEGIANLSRESQIGYAKVLSQTQRGGQLYTRLLFVETNRNDPLKRVLEKEIEIAGDMIHFDALIIKFDAKKVLDGKERSLYLWRRIYSQQMTPQDGVAIETPEQEPQRYADICEKLSLPDRTLFWKEIWNLSNNPNALVELGVKAVYGNVVYQRIIPGLIYVFKISDTGDLYPEVVPDL